MEFSQIQTYVCCNPNNFKEVLSRYIRFMIEIGFDKVFLEDSFKDLNWEVTEDGSMYVGSSVDS